jgi:hypothetical protein
MTEDPKNRDLPPGVRIITDPDEKREIMRQRYEALREEWRAAGKLTPARDQRLRYMIEGLYINSDPPPGGLAGLLREMAEKNPGDLSDEETEALVLEIMQEDD